MTDDDAEKAFITSVLQGTKIYAETIEKQSLPGGRRFIFVCMAGCSRVDGTTNMQLICNAGDEGLDELIRQLAEVRAKRRGKA